MCVNSRIYPYFICLLVDKFVFLSIIYIGTFFTSQEV